MKDLNVKYQKKMFIILGLGDDLLFKFDIKITKQNLQSKADRYNHNLQKIQTFERHKTL